MNALQASDSKAKHIPLHPSEKIYIVMTLVMIGSIILAIALG